MVLFYAIWQKDFCSQYQGFPFIFLVCHSFTSRVEKKTWIYHLSVVHGDIEIPLGFITSTDCRGSDLLFRAAKSGNFTDCGLGVSGWEMCYIHLVSALLVFDYAWRSVGWCWNIMEAVCTNTHAVYTWARKTRLKQSVKCAWMLCLLKLCFFFNMKSSWHKCQLL